MGGSIAAIESGWMQARIADSSYAAQQAIERGEQVVVGVNKFAEESGDAPIPLQQVDERPEREQVERLRALRAARDAQAVERRLRDVRAAAAGGENLMPFFVDAVDDGATLGEICNVLREVFGTYRAREVVVASGDRSRCDRRQGSRGHAAALHGDAAASKRFIARSSSIKASKRSAWRPGPPSSSCFFLSTKTQQSRGIVETRRRSCITRPTAWRTSKRRLPSSRRRASG